MESIFQHDPEFPVQRARTLRPPRRSPVYFGSYRVPDIAPTRRAAFSPDAVGA